MVEGFTELKIDGSYIRELILMPSQRIHMSLLRGPQSQSERQVALEYELQFSRLRDFRLNLNSKPWLEIKSHNLLLDADYLKDHLSENAEKMKALSEGANRKVYHFQINCHEGSIDIIAENFTISFTGEIPYFGSTHNVAGDELTVGSEQRTEPQQNLKLQCSFCGKREHEAQKIIKGPTSNICNECVQTCNSLLAESSDIERA
jgi:hypothetical protein